MQGVRQDGAGRSQLVRSLPPGCNQVKSTTPRSADGRCGGLILHPSPGMTEKCILIDGDGGSCACQYACSQPGKLAEFIKVVVQLDRGNLITSSSSTLSTSCSNPEGPIVNGDACQLA